MIDCETPGEWLDLFTCFPVLENYKLVHPVVGTGTVSVVLQLFLLIKEFVAVLEVIASNHLPLSILRN